MVERAGKAVRKMMAQPEMDEQPRKSKSRFQSRQDAILEAGGGVKGTAVQGRACGRERGSRWAAGGHDEGGNYFEGEMDELEVESTIGESSLVGRLSDDEWDGRKADSSCSRGGLR